MKEFFKKNKIAIISAIAVLVVVVVIVTVLLSNKKTNSNNNEIVNNETSQVETDDGDYITNKEWIILYAEKFGLNEYLEDEPYFENVAADESFFGYVQTMVEYEILDDTSELKLDETISPETVLIQLAKIYGDTYIENRFEKKELEKTDYIKFATENIGITIKDGAKGITNEEAISIIDRTWEHYLTKEYGNVEEIVYKDNVMDFISCGDYVLQDNTLYIASEKEISEGAVLVLATKDEYHSLIALKVTEVDKNDTNYILEVTDPELEDIVEYMNLEFSEVINLDDFKPAEGVTVVETTTVGTGFNSDQKGTVTTLEVNITDKKLKVSPEWEAINAKLNITESKMYNKNYLIGQAGQVIPKYKSGYEAIGKIKIKDLILNGSVEYDSKLAFDFNVGATAEFSLALKGYLKGNRMKVGEIEVKKPFSPVSFTIDFYVFADFDGEIKVEPKITAISTVKKTKNSGVTATGNVKTDTKVEFKASASVEAAPDAVLVLFRAVDVADAYMKIGAKAETTIKDDKFTIDMYLPTLKVGVGLNKNTVLSSVGISMEARVVDKDKATFKCPFRYTLEFPLLKEPAEEKPTEAPTVKPEEVTTEAPTQKPTEPPTTEAPTQKPTEPPTTEAPVPTEPVTQEPMDTREKIPAGCTYTVAATGEVLTEGNYFPDMPGKGDVYIAGDYKYYYEKEITYEWLEAKLIWYVEVIDKTKASYGKILPTIAGQPLKSMSGTFSDCINMINAPIIPSSVTELSCAFYNCKSLTSAPIIPNSVTDMRSTFDGCSSLIRTPQVPSGVINLMGTFRNCSKLKYVENIPYGVEGLYETFMGCSSLCEAPIIPNSVSSMFQTFAECTSLYNAPIIPNSVTTMGYTFRNCTSLINAPIIPNSVVELTGTFEGCTNLQNISTIPNSVTQLDETFKDCTKLKNAPIISSEVKILSCTFYNCKSLTGNIVINANPEWYNGCFSGVDLINQNITLSGTSTMLDEIRATASNY